MQRRSVIVALPALAMAKGTKLGTPEWDAKLRRYLRELNLFILDYNDGKMPYDKVRSWREAWEELWEGFDK